MDARTYDQKRRPGLTYAIPPVPSLPAIGCRRDATKATRGELPHLGNGAMRDVFTPSAASSVVYKIPRRGGNVANESEYLAMTRYRIGGNMWASGCAIYYVLDGAVIATSDGTLTLPTGLPAGTVAVLAMRKYPTAGHGADMATRQKAHRLGMAHNLRDFHDDNWRVTAKGRIRVTDLGDVIW